MWAPHLAELPHEVLRPVVVRLQTVAHDQPRRAQLRTKAGARLDAGDQRVDADVARRGRLGQLLLQNALHRAQEHLPALHPPDLGAGGPGQDHRRVGDGHRRLVPHFLALDTPQLLLVLLHLLLLRLELRLVHLGLLEQPVHQHRVLVQRHGVVLQQLGQLVDHLLHVGAVLLHVAGRALEDAEEVAVVERRHHLRVGLEELPVGLDHLHHLAHVGAALPEARAALRQEQLEDLQARQHVAGDGKGRQVPRALAGLDVGEVAVLREEGPVGLRVDAAGHPVHEGHRRHRQAVL